MIALLDLWQHWFWNKWRGGGFEWKNAHLREWQVVWWRTSFKPCFWRCFHDLLASQIVSSRWIRALLEHKLGTFTKNASDSQDMLGGIDERHQLPNILLFESHVPIIDQANHENEVQLTPTPNFACEGKINYKFQHSSGGRGRQKIVFEEKAWDFQVSTSHLYNWDRVDTKEIAKSPTDNTVLLLLLLLLLLLRGSDINVHRPQCECLW